jgi:hypothetical protein
MMTRIKATLAVSFLATAALAALAGCGNGGKAGGIGTTGSGGASGAGGGSGGTGSGGDTPPVDKDLAAYTLSYRSGVRVPAGGQVMTYDDFVGQVGRLDPIAAKRCPVSHDAEFQTAADALGGISWTHPVEILKDRSKPPLYRGKMPPARQAGTPTAGGTDAADVAPVIERPDLVGYQESTAIFLSQRHGLLAVRTDAGTPALSCALKLPGTPKYFFYHGKELLLLVNGLGTKTTEAAILRFSVTATGFDFVDAVMLDRQQIVDARLFDQTLIVYATLFGPPVTTTTTPPTPTPVNDTPTTVGGGATAVPIGSYSSNPVLGVKVTAVKWAAPPLAIAWQEEFPNDVPQSDPFAGQNPVDAAKTLAVGDVVSTWRSYKPFISASDRYVVVSRDVSKTLFDGTRSETYSYCAASHPGPEHSVTYCTPKYEQRKNPDYKDPQTTKGDYACNGKTLLDCIQEAAPTVSRYIYVRVGETCNTYTYHDYICDRTETQTVSYPTYHSEASTQFVVYRYADGDFVKLDEQLFQMASPGTTTGSVPTLTFAGKPLEVSGAIDHKGDLQFQHGHFYVLTNQGQTLHTLLIAGNSIAELGVQQTPRRGASGYSYSGGHSTLFSDDRMMVSRAYYDSARPMNISNWSDVLMLDLTAPSFPTAVNQFVMPGSSDQLILAKAGVLGPGTVAFTSGGVSRNLQKLTLFNQADASELDNLLLGTEYNADFVQTWLGVADDQRIRLDGTSQRLFLPYGGYHHTPAEVFNPAAHRLNITAVGPGLTSEVTFDLVEDIIRTVSLDSSPTAGRALAFGDSSVYALNQGPAGWSRDVIEEFATPLAVYRLRDEGDVHARIDRIGARCQISTFLGSDHAFDPKRLAAGPQIDCTESGSATAVGLAVVFPQAKTGWLLSVDGLTITALDADAVAEALTHVRNDVYCVLDPTKMDGTPVPYLDGVPPSVQCFKTVGGDPVDPPVATTTP